jgi:hypothetical protein
VVKWDESPFELLVTQPFRGGSPVQGKFLNQYPGTTMEAVWILLLEGITFVKSSYSDEWYLIFFSEFGTEIEFSLFCSGNTAPFATVPSSYLPLHSGNT